MGDGGEADLERFDYEMLEAPADVSVPYRMAYAGRITAVVAARGLDEAIAELDRLGHDFRERDTDPGFRMFREDVADGRHRIDITMDEAGHVHVSAYETWESWDEGKAGEPEADPEPDTDPSDEELFRAFRRAGSELWRRYDEWPELPRMDRALLGAYMLDMEVSNGGFRQYFDNTGGRRSEELLDYLEECGAQPAATVLRPAIALVEPPFGDTLTEAQHERLEEEAERLDELDARYDAMGIEMPLRVMKWVLAERPEA